MDSVRRFSNRVDDYIKSRPGYPQALLDCLRDAIGYAPWWTVADVGCGTGIFSRMLLERGNRVFGVEPNEAMRLAGRAQLQGFPLFHSAEGCAEATGLKSRTINLVTAAQAFHWFDAARARAEFVRILVPGGHAALVWNDRKTGATPFLAAYESLLLEKGIDYAEVNHRRIDRHRLETFFAPGSCTARVFENRQTFDWDGLYRRAMSSSYVPGEGHPAHEPFVEGLRTLYDAHAAEGVVVFEYDTLLYFGPLSRTEYA